MAEYQRLASPRSPGGNPRGASDAGGRRPLRPIARSSPGFDAHLRPGRTLSRGDGAGPGRGRWAAAVFGGGALTRWRCIPDINGKPQEISCNDTMHYHLRRACNRHPVPRKSARMAQEFALSSAAAPMFTRIWTGRGSVEGPSPAASATFSVPIAQAVVRGDGRHRGLTRFPLPNQDNWNSYLAS